MSLHVGQGFPSRVFGDDNKTAAGMNAGYNLRINQYSAEAFDPEGNTRVLIIGNSQARDFANILVETDLIEDAQLIYRSGLKLCEYTDLNDTDRALVQQADVIFFPITTLTASCKNLLNTGQAEIDNIVFVGPKHFGYNLNPFTRMAREGRPQYTVRVFDDIAEANDQNASIIPLDRYIDLIHSASEDRIHVRIFNDAGGILSADRVHVTQAGAQFFANRIRNHPSLDIFE